MKHNLLIFILLSLGLSAWAQTDDTMAELRRRLLLPLSEENTMAWVLPDSLEPNATMNFYVGTKGEKPEAGYPVFLYLHGSGPRAQEWATGLALAQRFEDGPSMYIVPQIPQEGEWYRWYQRSKQWAWERILRTVLAMDEVDRARIYIYGISEGGYGSQRLASFYADYLAGAGPMAGGEPLKNAPVENLGHVAFSFLTGERDHMFFRHMLTHTTGEKLDSMQRLFPEEYRHRVELIPGRGHSIDYSPTTPWLAQHRRVAQPRHFIWENYEMHGRKRNAFYNLQVLEESATYRTRYEFSAHSEDNSIDLRVDTVAYQTTWKDPHWGIDMLFQTELTPAQSGQLRVFLSPSLVNLKKKVTIRVNGKQVFRGKVKASEATAHLAQELWGDPLRDFRHAVVVEW